MSKRIITSCFIMFCTFSIFSLDLPLFPLVLSQSDTELDISIENINSMFASGLIAADKQKIFTPAIVNIDQENNQSSLFLRAVGYCKSKRIPFCAFGTIEFLNSIYELKVSVYDSNTESIVKTFYVKGDCLDLPILIKQLSLSIIQYAYKSLVTVKSPAP